MCGLFGIIGNGINREDIKIFRDLMLLNAVRGVDSTGFVSGRTNTWKMNKMVAGDHSLIKYTYDPIWFQRTLDKEEESVLDDCFHNYKLGHTRWATVGEVTSLAAQPFDHPNIVGTHNGTFNSIDATKHHSDSDAFWDRVNKEGITKVVEGLNPENDGYALVWYDKEIKRVRILRNKKKIVWFAYHRSKEVMYYSSEKGILAAALNRNGVYPEEYYYPQEDTMYSFDPSNLKKAQKPKYTAQMVTPNPKVVVIGSKSTNSVGAPFEGGTTHNEPNHDV